MTKGYGSWWDSTWTGLAVAAGVQFAFSFLFYGTKDLKYTTAYQPRATPGLVEREPERVTAPPKTHQEPPAKRQETNIAQHSGQYGM